MQIFLERSALLAVNYAILIDLLARGEDTSNVNRNVLRARCRELLDLVGPLEKRFGDEASLKIIISEALARGLVVIQYRTVNLRIVPV